MYILFILFFVSLLSITFMIGRKLALVKNGHATEREHSHVFVPDIQKIKNLTRASVKRYGYLALVATLRFYVRLTNTLQSKYRELKARAKEMRKKNGNGVEVPEQEASKFLKMISEYKSKIREIKHKIRKEEEKSL